jgi:xylulokinase
MLGADMVTVLPHGGFAKYYWDAEQCGAVGISEKYFPPFVIMGEIIGKLDLSRALAAGMTNGAASFAGSPLLNPGMPIAAGASDFIMALIGTGCLKPGMVCDRTGSSEGVNLCAENPPPAAAGLRVLPHAVEGLWNIGAIIGESGKLLADYRIAGGRPLAPYGDLVREALGPNPNAEIRQVLETMGRSFLKALADVEAAGFTVEELVLSGGQSRDPLWNQYKANLSGRILRIPEITDAELAGNAILGAAALEGRHINGAVLREKAAAMVRIAKSYSPE